MNRRKFLLAALGTPLAASLEPMIPPAAAAPPAAPCWRTFEVTTRVSLRGSTGPAQLWLPLAQTADGYQTALDFYWQGNDQTKLVHDDRYGAPLLHTSWESGLRVGPSSSYPWLGCSGDSTKAQHCGAEVYLDEYGWFPLEPADVRKVVLEQKIAFDSSEGHALREQMFRHCETNWIGYHSATDITLPGTRESKPAFPFLMYPHAVTEKGQLPCLDPADFHYEIAARELPT